MAANSKISKLDPMTDFQDWSRTVAVDMERALETLLPAAKSEPVRLHDAMRYATLGGGKRVRPMLAFAVGLISDADPERLKIVAAAVEIIHAYSLAHDDLPCMDDDVLRRGKPTCHIEFDDATALLAGDALQALAFELMANYRLADSSETQLKMQQLLARACGSHGMAGGQAIDLVSVGHALAMPELERMHRLKTGALIEASILLGAGCGAAMTATEDAAMRRFADAMGLAFQVVDDILDVEGSSPQLGKTPGKDALQNKPTYVSVMGLAAAKARANSLRDEAIAALGPFAERAGRLAAMADFILLRNN